MTLMLPPSSQVEVTESLGTNLSDAAVRIRTAAVQLFARRGYAATGIREIAREAETTNATLYHYTSSKEQLLVDIMRDGQILLTETARRDIDNGERVEQRLAALVGGLVATHAINPLTTRVVDTEIRSLKPGSRERQMIVGLRDEYEALWSSIIAEGAAEGVFEIADERLTRLGLLTMCTGMSHWYQQNGPSDLRRVCEHFIDLAMMMVRATRDGRRLSGDDVLPINLATATRVQWEPVPG